MPILAWRTAQSTNTTGTGTLALNAAAAGRRSFAAAFGVSSIRIGYVISGASFYEIGLGDFNGGTPGTLTRATVLASSNAGALVSLPAGTADVFAYLDPSQRGLVTGTGALTLTTADLGNLACWTGSSGATAALPAVASCPPGLGFMFKNDGTANLTLDPNAAELINGGATLVLLPGEAADVYRVGSAWSALITTPYGGFRRMARFTASGSWTIAAPTFKFRAWGGGGGGGGNGTAGAAGGGGGGGYIEDIATGQTLGASLTITVGAAGTAGANPGGAGSNNGGAGGTSSAGALGSATGGAGGGGSASSAGSAGTGGIGTGGSGNAILAAGGSGSAGSGAGAGSNGGRGGGGAMGGDGGGTSTGASLPGAFPGGGGGGGAGTNPGQAGGAGLVVLDF